MPKILKEPLLHFLALGLGFFLLFELVSRETRNDEQVIVIDREALLIFLQYQSRSFEPTLAAARLDSMSKADMDTLITDYVREEALHREALKLGMDKNDYIIKRRMIQSIEFITNGFATAAVELSDDDVSAYYETSREDYYVEPNVTFTHVFFSTDRRSRDEALTMATAKLAELNLSQTPFSEASRHGDRFLYALNYVEREAGFLASHFGTKMAERVFALEPDDGRWQGPLESPYGFHLVLLPRKVAGRYPELAEIRSRVRYDAERAATNAQQDAAIQAIVDTYEVRHRIDGELVGAAQ